MDHLEAQVSIRVLDHVVGDGLDARMAARMEVRVAARVQVRVEIRVDVWVDSPNAWVLKRVDAYPDNFLVATTTFRG